MLGVFEAGNWPCALVITQRLLTRADRGLGNSILQSGASIGAVLTPVIVLSILYFADPGAGVRSAHYAVGGAGTAPVAGEPPLVWPLPFFVVGFAGLSWVVLWFLIVPSAGLSAKPADGGGVAASQFAFVRDRRFLLLVAIVVSIQIPWQIIRAWLPKILIAEPRVFRVDGPDVQLGVLHRGRHRVPARRRGDGLVRPPRNGRSRVADRRVLDLCADHVTDGRRGRPPGRVGV